MPFADPTRFLATARERRKIMMRSTCRITRPSGNRTFDPVTGQYADPGHTVIYTGPCQIKPRSSMSSPARAEINASAETGRGHYVLCLPWDAPVIDMADTVEVTGGDDAWAIDHGPMPVVVPEHGDSRTHREVLITAQDRPAVNDA